METNLEEIKSLLNKGKADVAISMLDRIIISGKATAETYYLLGNAYRKKNDWQKTLNSYQEAIELDPESPAAEARKMVMDILNFYNKDMFNQ